MKTCPVCGARAFDDAETCFGCLHRFGDNVDEAYLPDWYPTSKLPPIAKAAANPCSFGEHQTQGGAVSCQAGMGDGNPSAAPSARVGAAQAPKRSAAVREEALAPAFELDDIEEAPLGCFGPQGEWEEDPAMPFEGRRDLAAKGKEGEGSDCAACARTGSGSATPRHLGLALPLPFSAQGGGDFDGWTLMLEWPTSADALRGIGPNSKGHDERDGRDGREMPVPVSSCGLVVHLLPLSGDFGLGVKPVRGCHAREATAAGGDEGALTPVDDVSGA